jgi:hypothetical protein
MLGAVSDERGRRGQPAAGRYPARKRRRTLRADGELRSATSEEWAEFEQHFLLRKVVLGERPTAPPASTNTPVPALPPGRPRPARTARGDDRQR